MVYGQVFSSLQQRTNSGFLSNRLYEDECWVFPSAFQGAWRPPFFSSLPMGGLYSFSRIAPSLHSRDKVS